MGDVRKDPFSSLVLRLKVETIKSQWRSFRFYSLYVSRIALIFCEILEKRSDIRLFIRTDEYYLFIDDNKLLMVADVRKSSAWTGGTVSRAVSKGLNLGTGAYINVLRTYDVCFIAETISQHDP